MVYKMRNDGDADVLTIILAEEGKISSAEEMGELVVHFEGGRLLFPVVLKASRIVPSMVEALARGRL